MTIQSDIFLQKIAADMAELAVNKTPSIHLVPWVPGIGVVTSLELGADQARKEMLGEPHGVSIDRLIAEYRPVSLGKYQGDVSASEAAQSLDDVAILLIDCSNAETSQARQIEFLNELLELRSNKGSHWIITENTDAFEQGLKLPTDTLAVKYRSRLTIEPQELDIYPHPNLPNPSKHKIG